jgi:hypothetical protein
MYVDFSVRPFKLVKQSCLNLCGGQVAVGPLLRSDSTCMRKKFMGPGRHHEDVRVFVGP